MAGNNNIKSKKRTERLRRTILRGLGRTLLLWFLLISLIPLAVVSVISYQNARSSLRNDAIKSMTAALELKRRYIQSFFEYRLTELLLQSDLKYNVELLRELRNAYIESGTGPDQFVKTYNWERISMAKGADLRSLKKIYGYYDVFLIDEDGNLLFTVMGEDDLGTNIFDGKYSDTEFGKTCRKAFEPGRPVSSDLVYYEPSKGAPAIFLVQVMVDEEGEKIGLMAFQIPIYPIDEIMQEHIGLCESEETYLVGIDLLMRSSSRFEEESTVLKIKVDTENTRNWQIREEMRHGSEIFHTEAESGENAEMSGQIGELKPVETAEIYSSYRGTRVLGVYRNLDALEKLGQHWVVVAEIDEEEAFGPAKTLFNIVVLMLSVTVLLIIILALFATKRIVTPVDKLSRWVKKVAAGDLAYSDFAAPKNEIGELKDSFGRVVDSFRAVTNVCENIAIGDFSRSVEVRGEQDVLSKSVNQMVENLRAVVRQAHSVAEGNYEGEIIPRSEKDELSTALLNMTKKLSIMTVENEKQNWFKTGVAELNNNMLDKQNIQDLGRNIIGFLSKYIKAQIGAIFIATENNTLKMVASYAYKRRKSLSSELKFGEGLVGQAALEKEIIIITEVPDDYVRINSGLGEAPPRNIAVIPFFVEGKVKGVLEFGSFYKFTELDIEFLEKVTESVGITVNTAQSRRRMEELLEKTRGQAHLLQLQQEELKQTNEELEEQTKALKKSEINLQQQQEELRVTNEELEERTKALEEQRDEISKKKAALERVQVDIEQKAIDLELVSKYKSEFLANMSHELRTPLNSILVLSQLLQENKKANLTEKQKEFAKTIHSSGSDLLLLINEVLDLSKVEAGKMELNIEEMNLREFFVDMKGMFSQVALDKDLSLSIDIEDGIPEFIRTDVQRVRQIVKNLLSNAFKFTEKGGVTLGVSRPDPGVNLMRSGLETGKTVAFAVSDTGIGISKEKRSVIFEAFQQSNGTTSRKYGGTGLGLSISRELANLLRGEIHLTSEEGRGTTFTLYLPEKLEPGLKEERETEGKIQKKAPVKKVKPASIEMIRDDRRNIKNSDKSLLIIEDDPNFCRILSDLAHEKGFKCLIAGDGETGLHFADYHKPSAVILDLGLPGINGWEVMERLKENSTTRHIPVHVISASDARMDALKMGAVGFLTKPVDMEGLKGAFEKMEDIISKPARKLLIVEVDEDMRSSIAELIGNGDVVITAVGTGKIALGLLKKEPFDCMILDLGLEDMKGFDLLEKVRKDKAISQMPVIIYTGKELSKQEEAKLKKYSESIIIKGARSMERLLDETTLFLHRVEADLPEEKQRMLKLVHNKEAAFEDRKILIVDDDMRNVFALTSVLEEKGMKVIAARNGMEGIEMLEQNPDTDLILMDIMMPEMNGYEAMGEIRKNTRFKSIPIIVLTAKAMKGDRNRCIDAGASDYLAKPVDTNKLLSLMRVWLYDEGRKKVVSGE